jgi:hypothetical protein
LIDLKILSDLEVGLGGLAEGSQFLANLIVNLDMFAFVLPTGELRVMEFLLEFGLHVDQFFLLGAALIDELFCAAAGS